MMKLTFRRLLLPSRSNLARIAVLFLVFASPILAAESDREDTFDLREFSDLATMFEDQQGSVRLVALLSPSCGYCIKGYRYMRRLLEEIPDERLKMFVVWEPMLSGDNRELAYKMARRAQDSRLVYQAWDPERVTGLAFTSVMKATEGWRAGDSPAWDVYFLYGARDRWPGTEDGSRPSLPRFWQHQGAGPKDKALDYDSLENEISRMLSELDDADQDSDRGAFE